MSTVAAPIATRSRGRRARLARVPWAGWVLLGLVLVAIFAPLIAPYDPTAAKPADRLLPPSSAHWFGTDKLGMDVFSRVVYAARWDLTITILGIVGAVVAGTPFGALAAYRGRRLDNVLSRFAEITQSFPLVLFALMVFAALGNSARVLVGVIAFVYAPVFFKLTRSIVLPLREADYVLAARCSGLSTTRILRRHIIPNALGPLAAQVSLMCAYALQVVAALSFLGLGVPVPQPEWGAMIQSGYDGIIFGQWWPSVFPGLAILITVIAFMGVGRSLRQDD
jgi:peptide/nickel transport system permease protein